MISSRMAALFKNLNAVMRNNLQGMMAHSRFFCLIRRANFKPKSGVSNDHSKMLKINLARVQSLEKQLQKLVQRGEGHSVSWAGCETLRNSVRSASEKHKRNCNTNILIKSLKNNRLKAQLFSKRREF